MGLLKIMAAGKSAGKRGLIRIFDVTSDRDAASKPRHSYLRRRQDLREIKRGRVPLGIGIGRKDDFPDFFLFHALEKILNADLIRTNAV